MLRMDEFKGKVALITGAGRGLGREVALALSSLGARVAANDINPINLDETVWQIQQAGGEARAYVFDIAKRMPIEGMVNQVLSDFDTIDILVNHACVKPDDTLLNMDEWEFHRTLDVNLAGAYFCIQQVGRIMQGGAMVNLISATGRADPHKGDTAYLTSQAGLAGLTCAAASELSAQHIRLNAVYGLPRDWGLLPAPRWDEAAYHQWREALPAMPPGEHAGIVSLVLYLCSQAAASLTGQVIPVR